MASSSSAPPNNLDYMMQYLELYNAVLQGNLNSVRNSVETNRDSVAARITENRDTALHVAVGTGRANHIVEFLLNVMSREQVEIRNNEGNTALSVAAIVGNVKAAKMLLWEHPQLNRIPNQYDWVPVIEAARHAHKDMITILLKSTDRSSISLEKYAKGKSGAFFVNLLILSGFYDLALQHVREYGDLAASEILYGGDNSLLTAIARQQSAFLSGTSLNFWQRYIYHREVCKNNPSYSLKHAYDPFAPVLADINLLLHHKLGIICLRHFIKLLSKTIKTADFLPLMSGLVGVGTSGGSQTWKAKLASAFKNLVPNIKELKLKHHQALELAKHLCWLAISPDYERTSLILRPAFLVAAELGVHEVIEEIIISFPHAVWFSDKENHNLFHLAVMNRQEKVFNLIFQMNNYKHLLLMSQDTSGNNILHLAGKLAPQHRLNLISGAALNMQRELQWFKQVEKMVQPAYKKEKNSKRRTPTMVFTETHMELVKEGEKWMKDTASSCSLVAALIATVVFAAAITVPGGNINDKGHPVFLKDAAFIIFGISNALSLFSSVAAILMFLSILTARYAEDDFLYILPKRLIWGLFTLFLSITSMMVAFSATVFLVFCNKKSWMLAPLGVSACLPVSLFAYSQFPLLMDAIYSTYGSGIFRKQSKRILY